MSDRGISIWGWVLGACVLVIGAASLLPLLARPTNCGGNTATLNACRSVALAFQTVALDRGDKPFSIATLSESERENFGRPSGLSWIPGGSLLVATDSVSITETQPKKILAVCSVAYDNVPRRWVGRSPMAHAVAYSDGSVGLISVPEFQRIDLSRFVEVGTIQPARAKYGGVWPRFLSEDETARCKQVAWEAASAPDLSKRCTLLSIPDEPVELSDRFIQYYLDQKRFDKVEVAIPSGRRMGWHSCYIGITVARGTYEVIRMEESFWP